MFGLGKNRAQARQQRNPRYGAIFYRQLENNARITNMSRTEYESALGSGFDKTYAKFKAEDVDDGFVDAVMIDFLGSTGRTFFEYDGREKDPRRGCISGYKNGLILIGTILFGFAPGLSRGLKETEELSVSFIKAVVNDTTGASFGFHLPDNDELFDRPFAVGFWRAYLDFLEEVDRK